MGGITDTLKTIGDGIFHLPGTLAWGISKVLVGDLKDPDEKKSKEFPGLLGLLAYAISRAGQTFTRFVHNNKTEISAALWLALIAGGTAALIVAFWPAALAAMAGLTIGGISIALLVGTGFAAQVAATGGAIAILTFAAASLSAFVVNMGIKIKNCFAKAPEEEFEESVVEQSGSAGQDDRNTVDQTNHNSNGFFTQSSQSKGESLESEIPNIPCREANTFGL